MDESVLVRVREGIGHFPDDPDAIQLFGPSNDDPANTGSNTTSYNNPELTALMIQANTVPGCDPAARAELYHQIEKTLQDDQPYVWLFAPNTMYAANKDVQDFMPYANVPKWNIHQWTIQH